MEKEDVTPQRWQIGGRGGSLKGLSITERMQSIPAIDGRESEDERSAG
jgi:hypothetical protein